MSNLVPCIACDLESSHQQCILMGTGWMCQDCFVEYRNEAGKGNIFDLVPHWIKCKKKGYRYHPPDEHGAFLCKLHKLLRHRG